MNTFRISDSQLESIRKRAISGLILSGTANQGADLSEWCGSVFNQLREGSCTACTTRDIFVWKQKRYGYPTVIDPAVNDIYFHARQLLGDLNVDGGATVYDAFTGTAQDGVIPASEDVYGPNTLFTDPAKRDVFLKAENVQNHPANTESIRALNDNGEPCGISVLVMNTLFNPAKYNGMSIVDVGAIVPNEGHAIFQCAYKPDPVHQYLYKIQGSWGSEYGDNGYIWFTESYLQKCLMEVCTLDIPRPTPAPAKSPYTLSASFNANSVPVDQPNTLTVVAFNNGQPLGNQKFEVSTSGPQAPYSMKFIDETGANGSKTLQMAFTAPGTYQVTVSWPAPDGTTQTITLQGEWA